MDKVQKPSNSECCKPSSESFKFYRNNNCKAVSLQYWIPDKSLEFMVLYKLCLIIFQYGWNTYLCDNLHWKFCMLNFMRISETV
jgi:hypothetical protein